MTGPRNLLRIPGAVVAGPTTGTVWIEDDNTGELLLSRVDGQELTPTDVRAEERARAIGEMLRLGAEPFYDSGAYCRGLMLRIPRPEPIVIDRHGYREVSDSITIRAPFRGGKPSLASDFRDADPTPWYPVQDPTTGCRWIAERIGKLGRIEQARDIRFKILTYASESNAARKAAELNGASA